MTAKKPLREHLSLRAYARRRGVSHTAVNKAVKSGRLKSCLRKQGRHLKLDVAVADSEWEANTDPAKARAPEERAGGVAPGTAPSNAGVPRRQPGLYGDELEEIASQVTPGLPPANGEHQANDAPLSEIRRQHISYQAELAKLELDHRRGQLVRTNEVRAEAFKLAREVRNSLLLIPNRLAPLLAAETNSHTVRQMLTLEITQALEALSNTEQRADG